MHTEATRRHVRKPPHLQILEPDLSVPLATLVAIKPLKIEVLLASDPSFNKMYGDALIAHYPIIERLWKQDK